MMMMMMIRLYVIAILIITSYINSNTIENNDNIYIIKIPVSFDFPLDNPPKFLNYLFSLKALEDPIDALILFCKKHELNYDNCYVIIQKTKELFILNSMDLYVQEYQQGAIINSQSIYNAYTNQFQLLVDIEYINQYQYCAILNYNPIQSVHSIQNFCDLYKLATIECDLLTLKVYAKYDIDVYKSLSIIEYFDQIKYSLKKRLLRFPYSLNYQNGLPYIKYYEYDSEYISSKDHSFEIYHICKSYQLSRGFYLLFMKTLHNKLGLHYGMNSIEYHSLDDNIYIMDIIDNIISENKYNRLNNNQYINENINVRIAYNDNNSSNNNSNSSNNADIDNIKAADNNNIESISMSDLLIFLEIDHILFDDIDFIEIGTSNFNTISGFIDDIDIINGYAIEPIASYLQQLPNRNDIKKVNVAISNGTYPDLLLNSSLSSNKSITNNHTSIDEDDYIDIYYIPEDVIEANKLDYHLKGCNSVNNYHVAHSGYEHLVIIQKVKVLPIEKFLYIYQIRNIKLLKIDTEGHDITILQGLLIYLMKIKEYFIKQKNKIIFMSNIIWDSYRIKQYLLQLNKLYVLYFPNHIIFESNALVHQNLIQEIIQDYVNIGYECVFSSSDTVLKKKYVTI